MFYQHAHNDYIEILLELGIIGVLLVLLFLVFVGKSIRACPMERTRGIPQSSLCGFLGEYCSLQSVRLQSPHTIKRNPALVHFRPGRRNE